MPIKYSVHPATIEDLDTLLRLNHELFEYEYTYGFTDSYNREWTMSDEGKKYFHSILEEDDKHAWIAFNEQKVQVGYLAASIVTKPYRTLNPVAEIDNVYIEEGYRCSGIGRTLVEYFREWCAKKDVQLITVSALVDNKHARDFYERWGFYEAEVTYEMKLSPGG